MQQCEKQMKYFRKAKEEKQYTLYRCKDIEHFFEEYFQYVISGIQTRAKEG
jgi:hypothetical protein